MDRVVFLGDLTDVPALLRKAELGVLIPMSNEGSSNSVLEYFAAGLPVIAADCGGNRELLEDGKNGILVPPRDPDALRAALLKLERDRTLLGAMGQAARSRIAQHFHIRTTIERMTALFREAAALRGA